MLYEDQHGTDPRVFGPHLLALDRIPDGGQRLWTLNEEIACIPRKGAPKLLAACRDARFFQAATPVVAVFDRDKLHRLLDLAPPACRSAAIQAIGVGCPDPPRLTVVLLEDNLESVIDAVLQPHPAQA